MAQEQASNKIYISVRFKLLLPFLLIILLVALFALPAARNLISLRLEQEADERLVQSAISFGLLLDSLGLSQIVMWFFGYSSILMDSFRL